MIVDEVGIRGAAAIGRLRRCHGYKKYQTQNGMHKVFHIASLYFNDFNTCLFPAAARVVKIRVKKRSQKPELLRHLDKC